MVLALILSGLPTSTSAQQPARRPTIWDVRLGTPVGELPEEEFVDPACGTNGGPPSRVLKGFAEFAQCVRERTTGLHEVWVVQNGEREYLIPVVAGTTLGMLCADVPAVALGSVLPFAIPLRAVRLAAAALFGALGAAALLGFRFF